MPLTPLTMDWPFIQERHIDYRSPVASDNHNRLLKTVVPIDDHRLWVGGFETIKGARFEADFPNKTMNVIVQPGIGVVQFMVIDIKQPICIPLFSAPVLNGPIWKYVVLEYIYKKTEPNSYAVLKSVDVVDTSCQLPLWRFKVQGWSVLPTAEEYENSLEEEDLRKHYLPEWALKMFVLRQGDRMSGALYTPKIESKEFAGTGTTLITHDGVGVGTLTSDGILLANKPNSVLAANHIKGSNLKDEILFKDDKIAFNINNTRVAYLDAQGVWGVVHSDIAELFKHDLSEMPKQGQCLVFDNETGKAVLSKGDSEEESVIGVVSYNPGFLLGIHEIEAGCSEYSYQQIFDNGKIPIAIMGQIKGVEVYADKDYPAGTLLLPHILGKLKAISKKEIGCFNLFNIVGKTLEPLSSGTNIVKILVNTR